MYYVEVLNTFMGLEIAAEIKITTTHVSVKKQNHLQTQPAENKENINP